MTRIGEPYKIEEGVPKPVRVAPFRQPMVPFEFPDKRERVPVPVRREPVREPMKVGVSKLEYMGVPSECPLCSRDLEELESEMGMFMGCPVHNAIGS